MAEKFDQFSKEQLAALAASPAGQQLMAMLRQSDSDQMQQAAAKASAGDLAGAMSLLAPLLADPQVRALLDRLGGK